MMNAIHTGAIPSITHAEAMRLAAVENARFAEMLRGLHPAAWAEPTDCPPWTVRDMVVHVIASAQAQTNPVEFGRQVVSGRPLTAEIGGHHWVDGMNEGQLRARTDWVPDDLPTLWQRYSASALTARRRMPAPLRALPLLPLGRVLDVDLGWKPLRYLFDVGFTRDTWMHRVDIARAVAAPPQLTADHDGRIIADLVAEWSARHGEPFSLTLTGPAGGEFHSGDGGEPITIDAVEFARVLSGRAVGTGVLRHRLPL